MADTATLSSKYQISIPKNVRETQAWNKGQEFVFIANGKGALMIPVPTLQELKGLAKGSDENNYRDRDDRY